MALFTNDKNCISTGLRADIMRSSMEDKNLLEGKGSIYVGTGEKNTLDDGTTQVMKTKALALDAAVGKVLMSNGSDLVYSTLLNSSFNASVRYTNLKWINGSNGSSVDGLTLAQNSSTGYLTLSGYISKLFATDGSGALVTASADDAGNLLLIGSRMQLTSGGIINSAGSSTIITQDGKFYGNFYTPDQGNQHLQHLYKHRINITVSSSITTSQQLQGAVINLDLLSTISSKITVAGDLINYVNKGVKDGNIYAWGTYVTPDGFKPGSGTAKAIAYMYLEANGTSGSYYYKITVRFAGDSADTVLYSTYSSTVTDFITITDTVTYADTGVVVS